MDKLKIYGVVYKITNSVNKKIYIGQTTQERGFKGRYDCKGEGIERYFNYCVQRRASGDSYNEYLFNAIKKYGKKSFVVVEEYDTAYSKDELDSKEIEYIKKYDSFNNGYNLNEGGGGNKGNCKGSTHYLARAIVCLNDNRRFDTVIEAEREYKIGGIYSCLSGKRNYAGIHPITRERMVWVDLEEAEKLSDEEKSSKINLAKRSRMGENHHYAVKVICLNDDERYGSIADAERAYGLKVGKSKISEVCDDNWNRKEKRYCVKHPKTKEELVFMYLEDYEVASPNEIADKFRLNKRWEENNVAVVCLNTGEYFNKIKVAEETYGVCHIGSVCRKERNYAGINSENGDKLVWRFIDEYESLSKSEIEKLISYANTLIVVGCEKKVVCLNTGEEFSSMKEAMKNYKISSGISCCCNGRKLSAGKHPETGESLVWEYKEELVRLSKDEIQNKIERAQKKLVGEKNPNSRAIILINKMQVFECIEEAKRVFNIKSSISSCCSGSRRTVGRDFITDERYLWMYVEDWNEIKDMGLNCDEINNWKIKKYRLLG